MTDCKYYTFDYSIGLICEIYRSSGTTPADFGPKGLWRAKKDGSWSDSEADVRPVLDAWMRGDFDPEGDEITREQADAYINLWRSSGWPGRE